MQHLHSTVKKQMEDIFSMFKTLLFSNPHSKHLPSDLTTETIESMRNRILKHFNTSSEEYEVIFTSSATDAIKLVGNFFAWSKAEEKTKSTSVYVYTEENHTSVLGLREFANAKGAQVHCIEIDKVEKSLHKSSNSVLTENTNCNSEVQNCLFAYPAQSNFSGVKYPLSWISDIQDGHLSVCDPPLNADGNSCVDLKKKNNVWFVLLDAASFVATSVLDLSKYKPDFVPISFYKIFGYPTGLGCLLVGKRAWHCLHKPYFGGGTVQMADSKSMTLQRRESLHEKFEDGTLPFLDIISLGHGFNTLLRITDSSPLHRVEKVSSLYNVHLRTGCVCNPGACQKYLDISSEKMKKQFEAGHICGDSNDLVDGSPTGSVRVSFGYMSTYEDADNVLKMVKECFIDGELLFDTFSYTSEDFSSLRENFDAKLIKESYSPLCGNEFGKLVVESKAVSYHNNKNNATPNGKETSLSHQISLANSLEEVNDFNWNGLDRKCLLLTDIIIYPVKSCAGISVSRWPVGECGLKYDRQWVIVNSSGVTLTMKRCPLLSLLKPWIDEDNNVLVLSYKGFNNININLSLSLDTITSENKFCSGRICGDKINGVDCGDDASNWLSSVLGVTGVRLVRQIQPRRCKLSRNDNDSRGLSLANESQYLAIHRPSLRQLLQHIGENQFQNFMPKEEELKLRFRPNFVFDGGLPYEEDEWKSFVIDKFNFKVLGHCNRCQMVNVNPRTGERSKEPMLSLGKCRGPSMPFGIHSSFIGHNTREVNNSVSCEESSFLKVGMLVYSCKSE
ncbi:Molybdenum cofactor sulfurase [Armadillidium vulgare]|nr:Molybdenum cofactor sulfurase [Armadillidium vulgare]